VPSAVRVSGGSSLAMGTVAAVATVVVAEVDEE